MAHQQKFKAYLNSMILGCFHDIEEIGDPPLPKALIQRLTIGLCTRTYIANIIVFWQNKIGGNKIKLNLLLKFPGKGGTPKKIVINYRFIVFKMTAQITRSKSRRQK